jgi:hypothetical protein
MVSFVWCDGCGAMVEVWSWAGVPEGWREFVVVGHIEPFHVCGQECADVVERRWSVVVEDGEC